VIVSRRKKWQGLLFRGRAAGRVLREMGEFLRQLRSRDYDWVIDNHGIFKSGLLVALSRGRRKIGFARSAGIADEGNYLFTRERYEPLSIERHAVERYLDLISQLGVSAARASLEYVVPPGPRKRAEELLGRECFSHPAVAIHPMAKWATKQWPPENFARLISALGKKKVFVVVTGSPGDGRPIMEILGRVKDPSGVLNLAGKTDLAELAGVFSLCDLVVTPDTGPMHLAAAVNSPLIALFGPTAPWRTGPYGKSHLIVRKTLACSPCFRKTCRSMECMKSTTVEEVLEAACTKLRIGS
jgi:3-deoxy-D-manno-octulosonic-acid transferase/heptosyltransferase-1